MQESNHQEGFLGGVPLNTETAAVNPRVGIARWQVVSPFRLTSAASQACSIIGPRQTVNRGVIVKASVL